MCTKSQCITNFILYVAVKTCESPSVWSDLYNLQNAITLPSLQRRKWRCHVFKSSEVTWFTAGGAEAELTVQSPPRSRRPVLRCLQRLPMALRINPQTLSHFPPMHARSLAFFHFLKQHLLFPAPGPLHVLLPLFKILPTHFFRLKPTHPLLPILRSPFHLTPD